MNMDGKFVYTIAEESVFIRVMNIPRLGLKDELVARICKHGKIDE
jgi:hypothetical protein